MQTLEYSSKFAVSQSSIKDFRFKSPKRWREIWVEKQLDLDKDEEAFTFGSLVDTILFTPELINKRFFIADVNKIPTATVEKIIRHIFDTTSPEKQLVTIDNDMLPEPQEKWEFNLASLKDEIISACEKFEWNSGWKTDTKYNKIVEKGNEYFNLLAQAEGRKIITSETNIEALDIVNKLRQNAFVKEYFTNTNHMRNIFQLEIFNKYNSQSHYEVPLKCAIDILHIDEENKSLRICDFKTSHSAHNFIQSIKQFSYCDQLSFYNFMLEEALKDDSFRQSIGIGKECCWKVLEPINIVIDEQEKVPYTYEYDWRDIKISEEGNASYLFNLYQTQNHDGRLKKGWKELLEEICWHLQNNKWEYPVEIYKTNKIKVNLINS
jgi:hypothetical protein